jgi:hypothetical protein
MSAPRRTYAGAVEPRDVDAALTLLGHLNAHGAPVTSLTVTHDELLAETPPTVTPPEGIAVLVVQRSPRKVDLIARVLGRRTRLRVARHGTH